MKTVNPNLPLVGGHTFTESDGMVLTAENWKKLAVRVAEYRAIRKLPPGQPWQDIMAQICQRNPARCHEAPGVITPASPSIKGRVFQWLGTKSREQRSTSGLTFVKDEEARKRAAVCQKCPNRAQAGSGCSSCQSSLAALRKAVLGGRSPIEPKLGACYKLAEDLPVAVHIDDTPVNDNSLPATCWRKKT
jgi:hypothetical protein